MKNKELLDKYTSRFVAEGLIKSVLLSSTLGFALSLVAAVVSLATGIKLIWLSVVCFCRKRRRNPDALLRKISSRDVADCKQTG